MRRPGSASIVALFAALLAAGCLGGGPDVAMHVPPPFGIADCTNLEVPGLACAEQDGVLMLSGHVTPGQGADPRWPVGIPIRATGSSIRTFHLRDLVIDGFEHGVHFAAFGHCGCTLVLENVTIRGPETGGTTGFSLYTAFNAMVSGHEAEPEAHFVFRHVRVSRMATALDLNLTLNGVEVDGLDIDCVESGMVARFGYGGISARSLDIQGCSQWAVLLEAVGGSSIRDSRFAGNALAVSESYGDGGGLLVDNVTFEENGVALMAALSSNSLSIPCVEGAARVERSRFVGNGARSPWLDGQGVAAGAFLVGPFAAYVRESLFEGNTPSAITFVDSEGAPGAASPLTCVSDAAHNYWGNANGPWRISGDALGARSQFGDAVPTDLVVDPFLAQPP